MSGRMEYPDPTPVEWPAGVDRPETLTEQIQRLVRVQMSQFAQERGYETFEEADDFDVDDDDMVLSPYELTEMQEERRFARDASNLERHNARSKEDGEAVERVGAAGMADREGVPEVQSDGVSEKPGQGAVGQRAGRATQGREGSGSAA